MMTQVLDEYNRAFAAPGASDLSASIVSRSADLFEGDLCDDELDEIPSVMMSQHSEKLQLNAEDLVDVALEEVDQFGKREPESAPMTSTDDYLPDIQAPENIFEPTNAPKETSDSGAAVRKPIVPFVVRKLSDCESGGGYPKSKKRGAPEDPKAASPAKAAKGTSSVSTSQVRITRSRAKKSPDSAASGPRLRKASHMLSKVEAIEERNDDAKPGGFSDKKAVVSDTSSSSGGSVSVSVESDAGNSSNSKDATTERPEQKVPVTVSPVYSEKKGSKLSVAASSEDIVPLPNLSGLDNTSTSAVSLKKKPSLKNTSVEAPGGTEGANSNKGKIKDAAVVPVDTSTAHVKALIGENGASVCLSLGTCTFQQEESEENAPSEEAKKHHSNLTEEQRAQQSRDRNRRHARNTRLRKKAYVEELKQTLSELVVERDAIVLRKEQEAQRESEQREVRFRVIEEFLNLRGRNEPNLARWSAILAEDFYLYLPVTAFQVTVVQKSIEKEEDRQLLVGVEQVMEDSRYFADFLESLGPQSNGNVTVKYDCDRLDFMMDGCNAVLAWKAKSSGIIETGSSSELSFCGTLKANFCAESNKLRWIDMVFDTYTIMAQRDSQASFSAQ